MLGSVSCLMPKNISSVENKSGVKSDGDNTSGGNPGEDNAPSKKSFISDWCGGNLSGYDSRRYTSDGMDERTGQAIDIHIINHDNRGLDRSFTEEDIRHMVDGETVRENGVRLIKVDGRVHTWNWYTKPGRGHKATQVRMNDLAIEWLKRNKRVVKCSHFKDMWPVIEFPNDFEIFGEDGDRVLQFVGTSDGRLALVARQVADECDDNKDWSCAKGQLFVFDDDGTPIDNLIYQRATNVDGKTMEKGWPKHVPLDVVLTTQSF